MRTLFRKVADRLMWLICALVTAIAILPLGLVLYYVVRQGLPALNATFFTRLPVPIGETGGGMKHSIIGTLVVLAIASIIGVPLGLLGGIFLAEYGHRRFPGFVRFAADVLNGTPSIVFGVVAYTLIVVPMHGFSALAGGVALAMIMIPLVLRTTEEMLRLVPTALRDASLALGVPQYRTTLSAVLPAARAGILTGIMLATARIAGETAPLIFTALNNDDLSLNLRRPISTLPVEIWTYAGQPFDEPVKQAWGGALILIAIILVMSALVRWATRPRHGGSQGRA
jgi:phosphate transport system permease protein